MVGYASKNGYQYYTVLEEISLQTVLNNTSPSFLGSPWPFNTSECLHFDIEQIQIRNHETNSGYKQDLDLQIFSCWLHVSCCTRNWCRYKSICYPLTLRWAPLILIRRNGNGWVMTKVDGSLLFCIIPIVRMTHVISTRCLANPTEAVATILIILGYRINFQSGD